MKKALLGVLKFVLFLVTFAVGSFWAPMHLRQVLSVTPDGMHVFLWDGVILMTLVFVLILAIEGIRRTLASSAVWTAGAYVLAGVAGYAMHLGFMTL